MVKAAALAAVVAGLVLVLSTPALAQDQSLEQLTSGLQAGDQITRQKAAHAAANHVLEGRIHGNLEDPAFESALLRALHDANDVTRGFHKNADPTVTIEVEEGHADYVMQLAIVAMATVPLLPPARQQAWTQELIRTSYNPESRFAQWLADFGDYVAASLIQQISAKEIDVDAANASAVLAYIVGITSDGPRSRQTHVPVSFEHRQQALRSITDGLNAEDGTTREIILALKKNPSPETIALLESFDRRASHTASYRTRRGPLRSLSDEVASAISEMRASIR